MGWEYFQRDVPLLDALDASVHVRLSCLKDRHFSDHVAHKGRTWTWTWSGGSLVLPRHPPLSGHGFMGGVLRLVESVVRRGPGSSQTYPVLAREGYVEWHVRNLYGLLPLLGPHSVSPHLPDRGAGDSGRDGGR